MSNKLFDQFQDVNVEKIGGSVQTLMECQVQYCKLVREYKEEKKFIERELEKLCQEKKEFDEKNFHEIRQTLIEDEVDENTRKRWMEDFQNSMNQSFRMSGKLLNDFAIKDWDEFRTKAEELIKGV